MPQRKKRTVTRMKGSMRPVGKIGALWLEVSVERLWVAICMVPRECGGTGMLLRSQKVTSEELKAGSYSR
jgi:hypothetical protein